MPTRALRRFGAAGCAALLLGSGAALGAEGVLEINHTCAVETGCFAGDAPGYPVTIALPGSYRLTGDLYTGRTAGMAIAIAASGARVDLGGFTIACGPPGAVCVVQSSPAVIDAVGTTGTAVRNGRVVLRGTGARGIRLGDHGRVDGVEVVGAGGAVYNAGSAGIEVALHGLVRDSHVRRAAAEGIVGAEGTRVERCSVAETAGAGIAVGAGSIVEDCGVFDATLAGILAGEGSRVAANRVVRSGGEGIEAGPSSVVEANTVADAASHGLSLGEDSLAARNAITRPGGDGIRGAGFIALSNTVRRPAGRGIHQPSDGNPFVVQGNAVHEAGGAGIHGRFGVVGQNAVVGTGSSSEGVWLTRGTIASNAVAGAGSVGVGGYRGIVSHNYVSGVLEDGVVAGPEALANGALLVEQNVVDFAFENAFRLNAFTVRRENAAMRPGFDATCYSGGQDGGGNSCFGPP